MDVEKILQQLREDGVHDSSDRFTLEIDRALDLLGRYTLDDPARRVLLVLSSAMAGGATRISFTLGWREWSATFDGTRLTRDELEGLVLAALNESTDDRIRDLGVAVGTARASGASIEIQSGDTRLIVARSQHVEARDDDGNTSIRISGDRLWSRKAARRLLEHAAPFIAAQLRIDGTRFTSRIDLHDKHPVRVVACDGLYLPALLPSAAQRGESNGVFAALLWAADDDQKGRVTVVLHGVPFVVETELSTINAVVVVAAGPKDLSHARLVVDDALRAVLEALRVESQRLVLEAADGPPLWRMRGLQAMRIDDVQQPEIDMAIARCALAMYAADDERLYQLIDRAGKAAGRDSDDFTSLLRDYLDRCRLRSRAAFTDSMTEAASLYARVVHSQREFDVPQQLQEDLVRHGILQALLGRAPVAIRAFEEAQTLQRQLGLEGAATFTLQCRGLLEVQSGRIAEGTETMRQAATDWERLGHSNRAAACERDRRNLLVTVALRPPAEDTLEPGQPYALIAFLLLFSVLVFPVPFFIPLVVRRKKRDDSTVSPEGISRLAHDLLKQGWRALDEGLVTLDG